MTSADRLSVLAATERNALETLLMDFDRAWKPELLHGYVEQLQTEASDSYRRLALSELVKIDLQRRWSVGQGRMLEEYIRDFPLLGSTETLEPELILIEFTARKSLDANMQLESYSDRYPQQYKDLVRLATRSLDSVPGSTVKPAQASIETSRIGNIQETKAPSKPAGNGVPVEFGRYRILRELGAGAMGTVHLAHDTQLDRQVALKTPSFQSENETEMVSRFYREARAAAKIQHRNICRIYDVGEIDGQHFITMAFIKGRTMSELIKPDKLPPPKTSAVLVHRLALALAEAHRHNVIHRDLKPANIMIDKKREPVVMDFGLARQTDVESRMTQSGMLLGTPAYMSPEQLSGNPDDVGKQSDVYALGVILYELLTGQLPFNGTLAQVVCQILQEEPKPPSEIREKVSPELESICAKMMAKNRDERFQSMEEVATAIKNHLTGSKENQSLGKPASSKRSQATSRPNTGESVSETGVLNEFFAAQSAGDPLQTSMESLPSQSPIRMAVPLKPLATPTGKPFQLSPARPKPSAGKGFFNGKMKWIATGLAGAFLFAAVMGIVFYFKTPYGTIRVETFGDLDGLEVLVDGNTVSLTDSKRAKASGHNLELKLGGAQLKLDPETNQFIITENGTEKRLTVSVQDVQLASNSFTVTRNKETVLKIELLPNDAVVATSGKANAQRNNDPAVSPTPNATNTPAVATEPKDSNDGWIDLIALMDPARDKVNRPTNRPGRGRFGDNDWRVQNGELTFVAERPAGKILMPVLIDGPYFELDFDFTRTSGDAGFHFGLPGRNSIATVIILHGDEPQKQVFLGKDWIELGAHRGIENKRRATARIRVSPASRGDRIEVFVDGESVGSWTGDREQIGGENPDDYPTENRLSLFKNGKTGGFDFHRIRLRMLDGEARLLDGTVVTTATTSGVKGPDVADAGPGWTKLFNGRDLTGWEVLGHMSWTVSDGVLVGQPPRKKSVTDSWLIRKGEFENFEMQFEYKLESGGNSGVFVRAVRDKDLSANNEFYEIQLLDDTASRYAKTSAQQLNGSLWDGLPAKPSLRLGPNQWHRMKIRVDDAQLQVWSNDQQIVKGKLPPNKRVGKRIGLQLHTGKVQFRHIRVKELSNKNDSSSEMPIGNAWTNAFNGRDLTGWKGFSKWRWTGNELTGKSEGTGLKGNTVLASERTYRDFEIEFETKIEGKNPNSGLQIRSRLIDENIFRAAGPQVDIGPGVWGDLYGEAAGGVMKKADAELAKKMVRPNDYNHYHVRCVRQRVTITINGTTLLDEEFPEMPREGILGWQLHKGKTPMTVRFRNIRILEVDAESEANRMGSEADVGRGLESDPKIADPNSSKTVADATALVSPITVFTSPVDEATGYDKRNNYAVVFSPNGEIVDTAHPAGTMRIRNVATGEDVKSPTDRQGIEAVAWSADRSQMVLGLLGGTIEVWQDGQPQPTHSFRMSGSLSIRRVMFSPDNRRVIACGALGWAGDRRFVESWSLADGSSLGKIDIESNRRMTPVRVFGLDVSSDGSIAAIAFGHGVQLWSLETNQELQTIVTENISDFRAKVGTVVFSNDGKYLGVGGYRNLNIVDVSTGKILHTLITPRDKISAIAFSPNGQSVVSGSWFTNPTVRDGVKDKQVWQRFVEWDLTTGKQVREWQSPGMATPRHLVFSADGRYLAAAGLKFPLRVWDTRKLAPRVGTGLPPETGAVIESKDDEQETNPNSVNSKSTGDR